jgi:hypothetical protein
MLAGQAWGAVTLPRQNLSAFTPEQWKTAFTLANQLPLGQRITFWADFAAVETTYVLDPLGEGAGQTPDANPLFDFTQVDCVTYAEQVFALALSSEYAAFSKTLPRIRYCDGRVAFRWRNHYLVSDWLPANAWFIRDVTDDVGAATLKTMTKTIARGKFFADKGLRQYAEIPDEQATVSYIPRDRIGDVLPKLQSGDLVIFVIDTPGIIAGHTGLIRVNGNSVLLQHASATAKTVVTLPLRDYLRTAPARFLGFKIARPYQPDAANN